MIMSYDGSFLPPGQLPPLEVIFDELTSVIWGRLEQQVISAYLPIDGESRDVGNTPTDVLRSGLILTKNATGTRFVPWGTVVDYATDNIEGILLTTIKMQRAGTNTDRHMGYILVGGLVKASGLIIPGDADSGIVGKAEEALVRGGMHPVCRFDDDPFGNL